MASETWIESADALPWGFLQINSADCIVCWNQWLEKQTDKPRETVLGKKLAEVYPERPIIATIIKQIRKDGRPKVLSQLIHRYFLPINLSEHHMSGFDMMQQECYLVPLSRKGGAIAITLRDVTSVVVGRSRERKLQQDLKKARDEANESARLKSEFLAMVSHEIRTPLSGIIGFAELLEETELDEEQLDCASTIHQSGKHLIRLLNDILEFSKIEKDRIELNVTEFYLENCFSEVTKMLSRQAIDKNISLSFNIDEAVPRIFTCDYGRLIQVLLNLLNNAIKFTSEGEVSLTAQPIPHEGEVTSVSFAVSDTGIGIPENKRERLFQAFTQVDQDTWIKYGGTGLGLVVSKKLIELMGGEMQIESDFGKGSTFSFILPLVDGVTDQIEDTDWEAPEQKEQPAETYKFILADDLVGQQTMISAQLKKRGHLVHVVSNGRECLEALKKNKYDSVLLELNIPVINGYEVARRIRSGEAGEDASETPILAITAHDQPEIRDRCLSAGMNACILKPFKVSNLEVLIEAFRKADV